MRTQRLIIYAIATYLVLLVTGPALANDNGLLIGKYRITIEKSCADVPGGFSSSGTPDFPFWQAMGTGNTRQLYFTGVQTYNGNGHVTTSERGTLIFPGPYFQGSGAVTAFEETGSWTYTVRRDGSFTQEGASFTATDGSYTVTGAKIVGQISGDGSVLILSGTIPPVVETLKFFSNGTLVGSTQRLCSASGTAVRIRHE
jgi:hypothetical protein